MPQGTLLGSPLDRIEGGIPHRVAEELKNLKVKAKMEADKFLPPPKKEAALTKAATDLTKVFFPE